MSRAPNLYRIGFRYHAITIPYHAITVPEDRDQHSGDGETDRHRPERLIATGRRTDRDESEWVIVMGRNPHADYRANLSSGMIEKRPALKPLKPDRRTCATPDRIPISLDQCLSQ
jgi:hypothetical protein